MVASRGLAPPPGGQAARERAGCQTEERSIRRSPPGRVLTPEDARPDGTVTTVVVGPSDMYIQIGAFTQFQNAHQVAARLGGLRNVLVTSKIVDGLEFFRVRAGPLD